VSDPCWQLDPRLADGSVELGTAADCMVRAMTNTAWPWLVLIPRQAGASELFDLQQTQRQRVLDVVCALGAALKHEFGAHKINIGALGNVVPQLHIHIVARFEGDAGWPGPVWGRTEAPLDSDDAQRRQEKLRAMAVQVLSAHAALSAADFKDRQ